MRRGLVKVSLPLVAQALFDDQVAVVEIAGFDPETGTVSIVVDGHQIPESGDGEPYPDLDCVVTVARRTFAFTRMA